MFEALAGIAPARAVLDACRDAGFDPLEAARDGAAMFGNAIAQPLLCAHQLAGWGALRNDLPEPALFAGYSVGELAAYGCAGALAAGDLIALARARAAAMDACATPPSGLLALRGLPGAEVEALCHRHGAAIAIVNGDAHVIIGGPVRALDALERDPALHRGGVDALRLPVALAAHTPLMALAVGPFATALERSALGDPPVPVLAGIDARPIRGRTAAIEVLARQLAAPVRWSDCLDVAYERGCRVFLELGSRDALSKVVRERFDDVAARSLADFSHPARAADWTRRALLD
jgi:[acyl-carrier-protein] S-malonyltransferase